MIRRRSPAIRSHRILCLPGGSLTFKYVMACQGRCLHSEPFEMLCVNLFRSLRFDGLKKSAFPPDLITIEYCNGLRQQTLPCLSEEV